MGLGVCLHYYVLYRTMALYTPPCSVAGGMQERPDKDAVYSLLALVRLESVAYRAEQGLKYMSIKSQVSLRLYTGIVVGWLTVDRRAWLSKRIRVRLIVKCPW
jgi:hypothetical protein